MNVKPLARSKRRTTRPSRLDSARHDPARRRRALAATALALSAALVAASLPAPATAGPAGINPAGHATVHQRGDLVSVTPLGHLSTAEVIAAFDGVPINPGKVRYGVNAYRVVYHTVDVDGRPTTASGLVVLPDGGPRRLPVVVWGHGTKVDRASVGSVVAGTGDREATELFAAAGYAGVAPDYLGLGTGPGYHPYMDAATEVSSGLDLLHATAALAGRQGRDLDATVRVTGLSQGGQAAMAIGRALQEGADPRWRLVALAPISGPYDLQHTELPALIDNPGDGPGQIDPAHGTFYVAYLTVSLNRIHHLYDSPSQVFRAPYDGYVEGLFDGYHDEDAIDAALPATPADLLTPEYLRRLRNMDGPLLRAIRDDDGTCQWQPRVPVRLYAADGDRDVTIANSQVCQRQLASRGVDAPLIDVGPVDHDGSGILSIPLVLDWFTQLG